uniref:Uncharacterized protein n=1 Tax=Meloidogyne enterolobii TaxID=390850 RepID=A0A6V7XRI3_MELEN|nr:unnamed protein product [Meloidogyne enterolobii]
MRLSVYCLNSRRERPNITYLLWQWGPSSPQQNILPQDEYLNRD